MKLTKEEYQTLKHLENWCNEFDKHASICPRTLSILIANYEENNKIRL